MGSSGGGCCRSKGPGGGFEAGGDAVVVVDKHVGNIVVGCAAVVRGDVAAGNGGDRLVAVLLWGAVCVLTSMVAAEMV